MADSKKTVDDANEPTIDLNLDQLADEPDQTMDLEPAVDQPMSTPDDPPSSQDDEQRTYDGGNEPTIVQDVQSVSEEVEETVDLNAAELPTSEPQDRDNMETLERPASMLDGGRSKEKGSSANDVMTRDASGRDSASSSRKQSGAPSARLRTKYKTEEDPSFDMTLDSDRNHSPEAAPKSKQPKKKDKSKIPTGTKVGRFAVLDVLGKGAFGTVYLAYDPHLDRKVAVKVSRAEVLADASQINRFMREARAAAQLRHPHIIPVYEVGENFIAYEYVEGETLGRALKKKKRYPPRQAAILISKMASALHYAHGLGIVHRDMKPENVIIDPAGEPHIADFGLAYRDDDDTMRTREGAIMGTPSYMSPEQASGMAREADGRSDLWSLGVMLQELLTGSLPFQGSVIQLIKQITETEVKPLRQVDRSLPRDLETIHQKCMARDRDQRYATTQELSDELDRWMRDEPIKARPIGVLGRTWRWARRNPTVAVLLAIVFAVLILGTTVSSAFAIQAHQSRKRTALAQVESLFTAEPASLPVIISTMDPFRRNVLPKIEDKKAEATTDRERNRLNVALLSLDDSLETHLPAVRDGLLQSDADEFLMLRDALQPHQDRIRDNLWNVVQADRSNAETLRGLAALAMFDGQSEKWDEPQITNNLATILMSQRSGSSSVWVRALRPVRDKLRPPLQLIASARDGDGQSVSPEDRFLAETFLADFYNNDLEMLVKLIEGAEAKQLSIVLPYLTDRVQASVALLQPLLQADDVNLVINAATALLYLEETTDALPLLELSSDNTLRTALIHQLAPAQVPPDYLIEWIEQAESPGIAAALTLALGEYPPGLIRQSSLARLDGLLRDQFAQNPSSTMHGAVEWLLAQRISQQQLQTLRKEHATEQAVEQRDWFINNRGQTFSVIRSPAEFTMGAAKGETEFTFSDERRRMQIPRSYAIAIHEVTVGDFLEFVTDRGIDFRYDEKYDPGRDHPMSRVNWYLAARYCNWLSEQEGIPAAQWCYPEEAKPGRTKPLFRDALERSGYRLATQAEWEYAVRAGSMTPRSLGQDPRMLANYAWYVVNTQAQLRPVGLKKPNDFGLFDVYGNVWEWCHDYWFEQPPKSTTGVYVDGADGREGFLWAIRGGSVREAAARILSSHPVAFDGQGPGQPADDFGLRVARTIPGPDLPESPAP